MVDFGEMAKAAKARNQGIVDAAEEKRRLQNEAEEQRLITAERALKENVLPILQKAAAAFEQEGIKSYIRKNISFRLLNNNSGQTQKIWQISFCCHSPHSNDERGSAEVRGSQYDFEHDGTSLTCRNFASNTLVDKFNGGTVDSFVSPIIARALDSYYEKLRAAH